VRALGPASSDSLKGYLNELKGFGGQKCPSGYAGLSSTPGSPQANAEAGAWDDDSLGFKLISPIATAPARDIVGVDVAEGRHFVSSRQCRGPAKGSAWIAWHRTISTDDQVIDTLVDELAMRGVDPSRPWGRSGSLAGFLSSPRWPAFTPRWTADDKGSRDHVVLVAEWDTQFGRALADLFVDEVESRYKQRCWRDDAECSPSSSRGWIHRFTYIRGLDGERSAASSGAAPGGGGEALPEVAALLAGTEGGLREPAVGTYQLDYLRRLSSAIEGLDRQLRRQNRGSIRAFGILGSDYYDKLLILAALKERFPSRLYFTTDLDARWITRKTYKWARNLIIASPFDLSLSSGQQGPIAPFRDSYQTSRFLATLRTVKGREAQLVDEIDGSEPLVFEVGRGGFYQLSPPDDFLPPPWQVVIEPFLGYLSDALDASDVQVFGAGGGLYWLYVSYDAIQPARWQVGILPYVEIHSMRLLLVAIVAGLFG